MSIVNLVLLRIHHQQQKVKATADRKINKKSFIYLFIFIVVCYQASEALKPSLILPLTKSVSQSAALNFVGY